MSIEEICSEELERSLTHSLVNTHLRKLICHLSHLRRLHRCTLSKSWCIDILRIVWCTLLTIIRWLLSLLSLELTISSQAWCEQWSGDLRLAWGTWSTSIRSIDVIASICR